MYYYLLDPESLPEAEFEKQQAVLFGLLHEFNISGDSGRISHLRKISDLLAVAESRQVKTLVVCGNDDTFNRVLASLGDHNFVLGFVPLVLGSQLAMLLGLDSLATAVKTLAARRIQSVDTAVVSGTHFFSYLEFGPVGDERPAWKKLFSLSEKKVSFKAVVNGSYEVSSECAGGFLVNARGWKDPLGILGNPADGRLDLLLSGARPFLSGLKSGASLLRPLPKDVTDMPFYHLEILEPYGLPLTMLGRQVARVPAEVRIMPNRLRLIVGKERTF